MQPSYLIPVVQQVWKFEFLLGRSGPQMRRQRRPQGEVERCLETEWSFGENRNFNDSRPLKCELKFRFISEGVQNMILSQVNFQNPIIPKGFEPVAITVPASGYGNLGVSLPIALPPRVRFSGTVQESILRSLALWDVVGPPSSPRYFWVNLGRVVAKYFNLLL